MAIVGGLLGFLIYNKYPAKVFMGDTGSLFLGGAIALMAVDMNMQLNLIAVGFFSFSETLSVILLDIHHS
jgi:phospho-N-acetylmuramoyl-pentapeptide-transferase